MKKKGDTRRLKHHIIRWDTIILFFLRVFLFLAVFYVAFLCIIHKEVALKFLSKILFIQN